MPRIKQLLREGKVVRCFGFGQLLTPKLVAILGEHGEFDALWIDAEHGGLTMKEIELATMAARGYGMDHFVRLAATDYAVGHAAAGSRRGGADDQYGAQPGRSRTSCQVGQVLAQGRARLERRQRGRPVWLDASGGVYRSGQCRDVLRGSDRDGRGTRVGRRDRIHRRRGPAVRRAFRPEPGARGHRRVRAHQVLESDRIHCRGMPAPASRGEFSAAGPSMPPACATGAASFSCWAPTSTPCTLVSKA